VMHGEGSECAGLVSAAIFYHDRLHNVCCVQAYPRLWLLDVVVRNLDKAI
jgi:hypothetical protein